MSRPPEARRENSALHRLKRASSIMFARSIENLRHRAQQHQQNDPSAPPSAAHGRQSSLSPLSTEQPFRQSVMGPPSGHGVYKSQHSHSFSQPNLLMPLTTFGSGSQTFEGSGILPPPVAPFAQGAVPSRPSSRGSLFGGSRPATPVSATSPHSAGIDIPKLHKKRQSKSENGRPLPPSWRVTADGTGDVESYDISPLVRGEPAQDLWWQDGDTMVYLAPKDDPSGKYNTPVFKIHSNPLMFAALDCYIENYQIKTKQGSRNGSIQDSGLGPTGFSFDVPVSTVDSPENASPRTRSADGKGPGSPDLRPTSAGYQPPVMHNIYFPALGMDPLGGTPTKKKKAKVALVEAEQTLQHFINIRNLFAFVTGTFLVASHQVDAPSAILNRVYVHLGLDAVDQDTIQLAETHLQQYVEELRLDDIRNDDDAIVDALVVGERWQCMRLYHEGFVHAAGRWGDLQNHPGAPMLSPSTTARLDRASLDLNNIRIKNVHVRLANFEFPSVWLGEGRHQECKGWRVGFEKMRNLVLTHMKHLYGTWPPKAGKSGKAIKFTETGGLNRLVLKQLYDDLCCIYELIVDREWLHGDRIHFDNAAAEPEKEKEQAEQEEIRTRMRKIMVEYDTSYVPVQPEMPFNLPRLPYRNPSAKKHKKKYFFSRSDKKVDDKEIAALLRSSYNQDAFAAHADNELVKEFIRMETDFGTGKSVKEFADARRGRWIFLYCVLQALPMLVVDAVGVRYTEGVEYFLCENFRGGPPWEKGPNRRATRLSGMWLTNPDGTLMGMGMGASASVTNLINPDDDIDTTYRRSHCWEISETWRLVHHSDDDEQSPEDIIAYDPETGRPIYAGEYIPGQQLQESPPLVPQQTSPTLLPQRQDSTIDTAPVPYPGHNFHLPNSGPAYAHEGRPQTASHPTYRPQSAVFETGSRPMSPSGVPLPGSPGPGSRPMTPAGFDGTRSMTPTLSLPKSKSLADLQSMVDEGMQTTGEKEKEKLRVVTEPVGFAS